MWKNKGDRKGLNGVYTTYLVKGLNLDTLINHAGRKGINLYDVKKTSAKTMLVSVNLKERQKFFAIAKEMCYNIKKVKDGGRTYPLYALFTQAGLIVGAIAFTILAFLADDFIFSVNYSGSGSVYQREVSKYLEQSGVKRFTRFSDIDLSVLEDAILKDNPHLSFASCKKSGNRLEIELVMSKDKVNVLDGKVSALYSDATGVVESLMVYRGTPMVSVGDLVQNGQLLVDGFVLVKEQKVFTGVLCAINLIVEENFCYYSVKSGEENNFLIFAEESLKDKEIISSKVTAKKEGEQFVYNVSLKYRRTISVG